MTNEHEHSEKGGIKTIMNNEKANIENEIKLLSDELSENDKLEIEYDRDTIVNAIVTLKNRLNVITEKEKRDAVINEVTSFLINIAKSRKDKRLNLLNALSMYIYNDIKANNKDNYITRNHLYYYLNSIKADRTRQRVYSEIVSLLLNKNLIVADTITRHIKYYQNMILHSLDNDSNTIMMQKNGYYRILNKQTGLINKQIARLSLNDELINDKVINPVTDEIITIWNNSELKSNKPIDKQGVYSTGNKSIILVNDSYKVNIFRLN